MAINGYYINNNSFHGLQISNLNTQELLMHFIIIIIIIIIQHLYSAEYQLNVLVRST